MNRIKNSEKNMGFSFHQVSLMIAEYTGTGLRRREDVPIHVEP